MSDTIIQVQNLSKRYRIGVKQQAETLASQLTQAVAYPLRNLRRIVQLTKFDGENDPSIFWALRDINFDVKQGEVLGIIGHNGAGKSTLLKILSRITEPTTGQISIKGRISALLEVGTGFHPELSGRDNVYMNGTILGMRKKEIDAKFDEIVAFSGVERHIDTPIKFYSSGMKVRLAFSVAAHLEPEILIIDEVLAVGDAEFQKKCLGKMEDVAGQGRTVLFVSHNMAAVSSLCNRVICLSKGMKAFDGLTNDAIDFYLKSLDIDLVYNEVVHLGPVQVLGLKIVTSGTDGIIKTGDDLKFRLQYKSNLSSVDSIDLSVKIIDQGTREICSFFPGLYGKTLTNLPAEGFIEFSLSKFPLTSGSYHLGLWVLVNKEYKYLNNRYQKIEVIDGDFYGTGKLPKKEHGVLLCLDHNWKIDG